MNTNSENEIAAWRKRLRYRAWHRGTRETDLLIGGFADKNLSSFGVAELAEFETMLGCSDPDLYEIMTGQGDVCAHPCRPMLQMLKEYSQSRGR